MHWQMIISASVQFTAISLFWRRKDLSNAASVKEHVKSFINISQQRGAKTVYICVAVSAEKVSIWVSRKQIG